MIEDNVEFVDGRIQEAEHACIEGAVDKGNWSTEAGRSQVRQDEGFVEDGRQPVPEVVLPKFPLENSVHGADEWVEDDLVHEGSVFLESFPT